MCKHIKSIKQHTGEILPFRRDVDGMAMIVIVTMHLPVEDTMKNKCMLRTYFFIKCDHDFI